MLLFVYLFVLFSFLATNSQTAVYTESVWICVFVFSLASQHTSEFHYLTYFLPVFSFSTPLSVQSLSKVHLISSKQATKTDYFRYFRFTSTAGREAINSDSGSSLALSSCLLTSDPHTTLHMRL